LNYPPKKSPPKRNVQEVAPLPCIPGEGPLKQYLPVTVDPVTLEEQPLWNATMAAYHPLGYRKPFGAHQRYWIHSWAKGRAQVLGALLFAAAARTVAVRKQFKRWACAALCGFYGRHL